MNEHEWPEGFLEEWRAFEIREADRPRGLDVYEDAFHYSCVMPLQRKRELAWMMQRAREIEPRCVVEIGADKGGGFYHWIKSQSTVTKAAAIEINGCLYWPILKRMEIGPKLRFYEDSSRAAQVIADIAGFVYPNGIDCLFLDGDKGNLWADFTTYLPMMRSGGRMFVHDFRDFPQAADADRIRSRFGQNACTEHVDTSESEEAMAREEAEIPEDGPYEQWLRQWRGESAGVMMVNVP